MNDPMLQQRLEPLDRETCAALALIWSIGSAIALAYGRDFVQAAGLSLLATACLSMCYLLADAQMRALVGSPGGAVGTFAIGGVVAALSFAGDCVVGSSGAPAMPLLSACVTRSGIGFAFTLICLAVAIGLPAVGLLRSALAFFWKRGR